METAIIKQLNKIKKIPFDLNSGDKYLAEVQKLKELSYSCSENEKEYVGNEILSHVEDSVSKMEFFLSKYKNKQIAVDMQS